MSNEDAGHLGLPAEAPSETTEFDPTQEPQTQPTATPEPEPEPTAEATSEETPEQGGETAEQKDPLYQQKYQNITEFLGQEAPEILNQYKAMGEPGRHTHTPTPERDEQGRFQPQQPAAPQQPQVDEGLDLYNPVDLAKFLAQQQAQTAAQMRQDMRTEMEAQQNQTRQAQMQEAYNTEVARANTNHAKITEGLPQDVVEEAWRNVDAYLHDANTLGGPSKNLTMFARELKGIMKDRGWASQQVQAAAHKAQEIKNAQLGVQPAQGQPAQSPNLTDEQKLLNDLASSRRGSPSTMLQDIK